MRVLLIDLDDTLYDERLYVESGFGAVAEVLAAASRRPAAAIKRAMLAALDRAGRGRVFDDVLGELGLAGGPAEIARLVAIYRTHEPRLVLYSGVAETLARLRRRFGLGIVTDGLASMQRLKVVALALEALVDTVVYCGDEQAPKPSTAGFRRALADLGAEARDAAIVGDAPHADMAAAAALGIPSIRVRGGRFKSADNSPDALPAFEISAFTDIEPALERLAAKEFV